MKARKKLRLKRYAHILLMAEKYNLGAINILTKQYTSPNNANKTAKYQCTECEQRVILRKGTVRKAHFAHYSQTNTCSYYDHPNESQLHKDAKYKLQEKLNNKFPITLNNICPECSSTPAAFDDLKIEYIDGDISVVEYRDPNKKYVADVALLNNGKVRYIFEIKHTHATTTSVRPEPWFEFTAEQIFEEDERITKNDLNDANNVALGQEYYLNCVRTSLNRFCPNCRIYTESWTENLPRLSKKYGQERMWKQDFSCIKCKREQYNPVFVKGFRQICKICICDYEDELKTTYDVNTCMILDD